MFHPGVRRTLTAAVLLIAAGTPAAAQTLPTDPVAEGYHLLYSGDKAGRADPKNLLAANPDDLPRRFGLPWRARPLTTTAASGLRAGTRRARGAGGHALRSHERTEALFYAAQGHMMRAGIA
jgi:hypothetical protein